MLAIAFAAAMGSWGLADRGAVFVDEGYQVLEARWVGAKASYLVDRLPDRFSEREFVLRDGDGLPPYMGKPLHAVLNAAALGLLPGEGPLPVLILQGLFGLGIIVVVYAIGRRLGGALAAAAAAWVLAASAGFLLYRRAALPEMDSGFFFALAVWMLVVFHQRGGITPKRAAAAGVLGGLCFTASDRGYIALPALLLITLALEVRRPRASRGNATLTGLAIVGGFAAPVLAFEAVSAAFLWMGHDAGVRLPYETYFQQLHRRYREVVDVRAAGPRLNLLFETPYPGDLAAWDGRPWVIVMGASLVYLAVRPRRAHAVPLIWALAPLVSQSASPLTEPRYISLALPGLALAAGLAVARAWAERRTFVRAVAVGAAVVAILSSVLHTPRTFRVRAGWDRPLAIVASRGDGKVISPKYRPIAAHVGIDRIVLGYRESLDWARDQQRRGARWLLLELWPDRAGMPLGHLVGRAGTVIGPVGELSAHFLREARPVYVARSAPTRFRYEGFPEGKERILVLYDLTGA